MSDEIKPCPFCKCANFSGYIDCGEQGLGVAVRFTHPPELKCVLSGYKFYKDEWNRRATVSIESVLNESAPAKSLTARKTEDIITRDGSEITGFVVTDKHGGIGIIDKSAVRWLSKEEMWWLMHDSTSPLNKATVSKETVEMLVEALKECIAAIENGHVNGFEKTSGMYALHRSRPALARYEAEANQKDTTP